MPTWTSNIPSQVKTYANTGAFPVTGSVKTIYIAEDTDIAYYWTGSAYQAISIQDLSGLVPYTGATSDVDLGNNDLNAEGIKIKGTAGNGHLNLKHQSSNATAGGQETVIFAGADGEPRFKNDGNAVEQFASREWVGLQGFITNVITALGFTPVPQTRTINGLDLTANRTLTTANINDSTNRRYVTDAQLTVIGNTTGTNTGDETQSSILSKLGWWNILNQTAGTVSSGTTNTITKSIALPSVPSVLNFRAVFSKTGGNGTFTVRSYLSDVDNNIGGTAILIGTITSTAGNVTYLPIKRTTDFIGGNAIGLNASQTALTDDFQTTTARLNTAYPTGTPLYLIFAVQCANASDSARFESCMINNFTF